MQAMYLARMTRRPVDPLVDPLVGTDVLHEDKYIGIHMSDVSLNWSFKCLATENPAHNNYLQTTLTLLLVK